jgi:hypothetical protein
MKAILNIKKQPWTGWVREQPDPVETKVEAEKGTKLDYVSGTGASANIEDVLKDHIILVTSGLALRKEGTGINLGGDFKNLQTEIKLGESVKFTTQSMDGGDTYTFTLSEIVN